MLDLMIMRNLKYYQSEEINEEEWNKYVHSIEDDKNQFFDEDDELINITIEDKAEFFKMKNEVDTQEVQDDENTKATVSEEKNKNQKKFKRFRFQKLKVLLEMIYNLLQRKMMKKKSNVLKISKSDKIEIEASQWNQLYVKKE
jgi:hypothetical protein